MSSLNINFELHNDISISNEETIASHTSYINKDQYIEAKSVVDSDAGMNGKGFRASIFNIINRKIQELQIYLLNKKAEPYEYYSLTEPDKAWMEENGYKFWIQPLE
jgi:hypothetical protein